MAEYIVPSVPSTRVRCPGTASLSTIAPTMKTKHAILSLAIAAFAALGAYVYWGEATQPAPQTSFLLLDGSSTSTQALQGKVTLVIFWATSCTTCVAEMPDIAATYNKYKDQGFDTLAVAMQYDPPQYVLNFAQSRQLPFKVALDNTGAVAKAWGDIQLTPTTYLVDKRGHIVKTYIGAPNFEELHRLIEKLLAQA